jgi:hypothetical protein
MIKLKNIIIKNIHRNFVLHCTPSVQLSTNPDPYSDQAKRPEFRLRKGRGNFQDLSVGLAEKPHSESSFGEIVCNSQRKCFRGNFSKRVRFEPEKHG